MVYVVPKPPVMAPHRDKHDDERENDDEIPIHLCDVGLFAPGELVGANDNGRLNERVEIPLFDFLVERPCFENGRWQEEFVGKFLAPLFA